MWIIWSVFFSAVFAKSKFCSSFVLRAHHIQGRRTTQIFSSHQYDHILRDTEVKICLLPSLIGRLRVTQNSSHYSIRCFLLKKLQWSSRPIARCQGFTASVSFVNFFRASETPCKCSCNKTNLPSFRNITKLLSSKIKRNTALLVEVSVYRYEISWTRRWWRHWDLQLSREVLFTFHLNRLPQGQSAAKGIQIYYRRIQRKVHS